MKTPKRNSTYKPQEALPEPELKLIQDEMSDPPEETKEFTILLPQHGHFWDNGYEDVG